jgi:hypothetical protein
MSVRKMASKKSESNKVNKKVKQIEENTLSWRAIKQRKQICRGELRKSGVIYSLHWNGIIPISVEV